MRRVSSWSGAKLGQRRIKSATTSPISPATTMVAWKGLMGASISIGEKSRRSVARRSNPALMPKTRQKSDTG
jgi:hypothetical protein